MRLLITGAGRGGTCWLTEIVRASNFYNFTKKVEDRKLFQHRDLPNLYATKLATENPNFTWENVNKLMVKYSDLYVLFSIRHPIALCMSKIVRGQPNGDGTDRHLSADATVDTSTAAVRYMYNMYIKLKKVYPNRVYYIKLESIITDREKEVNKICKILGIKFDNAMLEGHKNARNKYHQKRYGKKVDISQADIYTNWESVYDGFFKNRKDDMNKIREKVKDIAEYFDYEIMLPFGELWKGTTYEETE